MKIGVFLPSSGDGATRSDISAIAEHAETAGFDSVWVADHIVAPRTVRSPYPFSEDGSYHNHPETPYLEPLTTLAFAAGVTQSVRLVLSVLIVPYRHPLATAKVVATLDVLSDGRLTLGVGVGWMAEEFQALGHDYFSRRGQNTNEQLEIMKTAWERGSVSFKGEFYEFSEVVVSPSPIQRPLPVWVGGHSDAALRRAVRFGDAAHCNAGSPQHIEAVKQKLELLSGELDRMVPPALTLRCHVAVAPRIEERGEGHLVGPLEYIVEKLSRFKGLGVGAVGIDSRVDGVGRIRDTLEAVGSRLAEIQ